MKIQKKVNYFINNFKLIGFIFYDINNNNIEKYFKNSNINNNNEYSIFPCNTSFNIFNKVINILYLILFQQKFDQKTSKNYLDYMDVFKPFIYKFFNNKDKITNKNSFKKFSEKLIFCSFFFLKDKEKILSSNDNYNIKYKFFNNSNEDFENFINLNFYLITYLCLDVNKFLIKNARKIKENCDYYFEDEYNEKIYNLFSTCYNDKNNSKETGNFINIYSEYNPFFHHGIKTSFKDNINLLNEFVDNFFSNIDKYSYKFKDIFKILLVFVTDIDQVNKKINNIKIIFLIIY